MGFDFFQTRRTQYEHCKWWSRLESDETDEDEIIYKRIPSGEFDAEEVNAESQDDNVIGGVFMLEKTAVTIKSCDDLTNIYNKKQDIRNKVLVEYQDEIWRVENVQKRKARVQNSEFGSESSISYYWYLSLIKD